ncbi:MAG: hypothetical protein J6I53_08450 [Treponema sp.]|nr:hypothetical protein [Treponema sp.]
MNWNYRNKAPSGLAIANIPKTSSPHQYLASKYNTGIATIAEIIVRIIIYDLSSWIA